MLGSGQTWNAAGGPLSFGGAIDNNRNTLSVDGGFNTTILSTIGSGGGLIKNGSGTLTLGNGVGDTFANTYSGLTTVNAGTLTLDKAVGTVAIPGDLVSNGGTVTANRSGQFSTFSNVHTGQPVEDGRLGLDLIGDPYAGASHSFVKGVGEQWWNGNAFALPLLPGGNLSRNKLHAPGFASVDVSVIKNLPITERLKVQLRADMFNIFNRKNLAGIFGGVNESCAGIPTVVNGVTRSLCGNAPGGFGWVRDTISDSQAAPGIGPGEPFQMQLAAKIIF